jgi:serine protease Do
VGSNGKTVDATDPNDRLETRWFGYRLDSVAKWETVDWTKWRDQARKVSEFRGNSIALWYAYTGNLPEAALNPRLRALIDRFESRTAGSASEQTADFIRSVRAYAADGEKDFANADYYDFFRTSLYWGTSVPGQVKYRDFLIQGFDEIADSLPAYLARLKK